MGRLLIPYIGGGELIEDYVRNVVYYLIINYFGYFKDVEEDKRERNKIN